MQVTEIAVQVPFEDGVSPLSSVDLQDEYGLIIRSNGDTQFVITDTETIEFLKDAKSPYLRDVYRRYQNGDWEYADETVDEFLANY